jgi:hypothetical protein
MRTHNDEICTPSRSRVEDLLSDVSLFYSGIHLEAGGAQPVCRLLYQLSSLLTKSSNSGAQWGNICGGTETAIGSTTRSTRTSVSGGRNCAIKAFKDPPANFESPMATIIFTVFLQPEWLILPLSKSTNQDTDHEISSSKVPHSLRSLAAEAYASRVSRSWVGVCKERAK